MARPSESEGQGFESIVQGGGGGEGSIFLATTVFTSHEHFLGGSNPELPGENRKCYHCAKPPPLLLQVRSGQVSKGFNTKGNVSLEQTSWRQTNAAGLFVEEPLTRIKNCFAISLMLRSSSRPASA